MLKCLDHKTGDIVAVKINRNDGAASMQVLNEVKILKYLQENDPAKSNLTVHLIDYFTFRSHVCMVFELLSATLLEVRIIIVMFTLFPSLPLIDFLVLYSTHVRYRVCTY